MAVENNNISQNIYDYWLKSRIAISTLIIYVLIVVTIILLNSDLNIMPSSSALSFGLTSHQTPKPGETNTPSNFEGCSEEENEEDPLVPPAEMNKEERMAWFKTQLPKLEILKPSKNSLASFHLRVLSFLSQNCSMFFHAVWLSPAKFFGEREFMTMETLLKVHPQGCLLILSKSMESKLGYRILKPLLDRGFKVLAIEPDLPFLVKKTAGETWLEQIKSGNKDPGNIPFSQNLSNLIRLAMLYKYGGVYLDTDLIVVKDLSPLRNAIGAQALDPDTKKWVRLNTAVMVFDMHHPILLEFLKEFASTYDGNKWGYNGPYMASRVVARVETKPGYNITILPPMAFYPVDWIKIPDFYKKPKTDGGAIWTDNRVVELLYGGKTYALHLWNKKTRDLDIENGSVIARLYSNRCVVCYNITNVTRT